MVRAAAKNHPSVAIVTDPERYADVIDAVRGPGFSLEQRRGLALEAFSHTADYDAAVSDWFAEQVDSDGEGDLRYGENPHQAASLINEGWGLANAVQHGGGCIESHDGRVVLSVPTAPRSCHAAATPTASAAAASPSASASGACGCGCRSG